MPIMKEEITKQSNINLKVSEKYVIKQFEK